MSQRFTVQGELNRIDSGLRRDAQHDWGTQVKWWRYDPSTKIHDVYDVGEPRQFRPFVWVPALQAIVSEGRNVHRDEGLYTADSILVVVSKNALRDHLHWYGILNREGLKALLRDRIGYEGRVFTIHDVQLEGQLRSRDTVVAIQGQEVRVDERSLEPEFDAPSDVYDIPEE